MKWGRNAMAIEKLTDLCTIQYGYAFDSNKFSDDSSYLPLIRIRDVKRGYSETYYSGDYPEEYIIHDGDLLVGMDGEFNIARWHGGDALLNQRVCKISAKAGVNEEYLRYALSLILKKIEGRTSFVTVKHLSAKELNKVELNVTDKVNQNLEAGVLKACERIKDTRQSEMDELDTLIKARFVELFGDPINNPMNWDTDSVEALCDNIYGGGTPSKSHPEYYENGNIPWISSKDMKTDIIYDSQIHINQLGVDNSTAQMVPENSVIMVIRSGILKHTLPVAVNAVPVTVNQDLKVFIPSERLLTKFMAVQFKILEKDILSGVRAVTADNIEFNSLKRRKLIVPPIEKQRRYVDFISHVDKSKSVVQKSLDETQVLFDSLMQKYFG